MATYTHVGTLPLVLDPSATGRTVRPGETVRDDEMTAEQLAFFVGIGALLEQPETWERP